MNEKPIFCSLVLIVMCTAFAVSTHAADYACDPTHSEGKCYKYHQYTSISFEPVTEAHWIDGAYLPKLYEEVVGKSIPSSLTRIDILAAILSALEPLATSRTVQGHYHDASTVPLATRDERRFRITASGSVWNIVCLGSPNPTGGGLVGCETMDERDGAKSSSPCSSCHGGGSSGPSDGIFFSPVVVDLGGDGFAFGERGAGVHFDMTGDGHPETLQWVRPGGDEAFLVLDRNGNGLIDDGGELFGDNTPLELQPGATAVHGYRALAQYDQSQLGGNGDYRLSEQDDIWRHLLVWRDANADGVSTDDEVQSVETAGLVGIGVIPRSRDVEDDSGNLLPLWARARVETSRGIENVATVDVFFRGLPR